jgi:hypothetical protein
LVFNNDDLKSFNVDTEFNVTGWLNLVPLSGNLIQVSSNESLKDFKTLYKKIDSATLNSFDTLTKKFKMNLPMGTRFKDFLTTCKLEGKTPLQIKDQYEDLIKKQEEEVMAQFAQEEKPQVTTKKKSKSSFTPKAVSSTVPTDKTPLKVIQKEFQKANPTLPEEITEKPQLSTKDKETRIRKLTKFITTGKLERLLKITDDEEFERALQSYVKTELPALLNKDKEISEKDLFNISEIKSSMAQKDVETLPLGLEETILNSLNVRGILIKQGARYKRFNELYPDDSANYEYKLCESRNKGRTKMGSPYDVMSKKIYIEVKYYLGKKHDEAYIQKQKIFGTSDSFYTEHFNKNGEVLIRADGKEYEGNTYRKLFFIFVFNDGIYFYDFSNELKGIYDMNPRIIKSDGTLDEDELNKYFDETTEHGKKVYKIAPSNLHRIYLQNVQGSGIVNKLKTSTYCKI